jgi:hypothetical protein
MKARARAKLEIFRMGLKSPEVQSAGAIALVPHLRRWGGARGSGLLADLVTSIERRGDGRPLLQLQPCPLVAREVDRRSGPLGFELLGLSRSRCTGTLASRCGDQAEWCLQGLGSVGNG